MTKFRFRVDTPWGKKGEEASAVMPVKATGSILTTFSYDPSHWPDLFEPIPKVDPVGVVAEWLFKKYVEWEYEKSKLLRKIKQQDDGVLLGETDRCHFVAKALIEAGVDCERLK